MHFEEKITLKNGKEALIRNAVKEDGQAVLDIFNLTHAETDYLLSYPDEKGFGLTQEEEYLDAKAQSENEVELLAIVDGKVVGMAGSSAEIQEVLNPECQDTRNWYICYYNCKM